MVVSRALSGVVVWPLAVTRLAAGGVALHLDARGRRSLRIHRGWCRPVDHVGRRWRPLDGPRWGRGPSTHLHGPWRRSTHLRWPWRPAAHLGGARSPLHPAVAVDL